MVRLSRSQLLDPAIEEESAGSEERAVEGFISMVFRDGNLSAIDVSDPVGPVRTTGTRNFPILVVEYQT